MYSFHYKIVPKEVLGDDGSIYTFIILKQDDRLYGLSHIDTKEIIYTCRNGIKIKSSSSPEIRLSENKIFIKGSCKEISLRNFVASNEDLKRITEALEEFRVEFCKSDQIQNHKLTKIFK